MKWRPDLILVAMTLHNDVHDNLRQRFHATMNGALVEQPSESPFFGYQIIQLKGFLATHSHAYQLLVRARRAREVQDEARELGAHVIQLFRESGDERISRGLELTFLLLERMGAIASADGSRLALVLLPLAVQLSGERFGEFARAAVGSARGLEIDRPQRLMRDLGGQLGIEVTDLLPGFREWTAGGGARLYLERDGHWNEAGHRLATDIVASELVRLGLVREQDGGAPNTPNGTLRSAR
jgi:hypothetical protein